MPQLAYEIATELLNSILLWKPDFKKPSKACFEKWADAIDKAMRLDHRTELKMKQVIAWIPRHEGNNGFTWRANILSGNKFRSQFDKLEMAMNTSKKGQPSEVNRKNFDTIRTWEEAEALGLDGVKDENRNSCSYGNVTKSSIGGVMCYNLSDGSGVPVE